MKPFNFKTNENPFNKENIKDNNNSNNSNNNSLILRNRHSIKYINNNIINEANFKNNNILNLKLEKNDVLSEGAKKYNKKINMIENGN